MAEESDVEIYGQPTGENAYNIIDSPHFVYWMPVLKVDGNHVIHPWSGGYKVHVSLEPRDAERVAERILPELQQRGLDHKVYHSIAAYRSACIGPQAGKFITIYPGPVLEGFTKLVNWLDPILASIGAKPGPEPRSRLEGHKVAEQSTGLSGTLYYVTVASYST